MAWKWQALDGVITKAPLGGEATGSSPVDRGKQGTKRSVWTDQRGVPLVVQVTGANTPAKTVVLATLASVVVERPKNVVYLWTEAMSTPKSSKGSPNSTITSMEPKAKPTRALGTPQRSIRPGDGSSNEPMRGILGADGCGADGKKRELITKHSFRSLPCRSFFKWQND